MRCVLPQIFTSISLFLSLSLHLCQPFPTINFVSLRCFVRLQYKRNQWLWHWHNSNYLACVSEIVTHSRVHSSVFIHFIAEWWSLYNKVSEMEREREWMLCRVVRRRIAFNRNRCHYLERKIEKSTAATPLFQGCHQR